MWAWVMIAVFAGFVSGFCVVFAYSLACMAKRADEETSVAPERNTTVAPIQPLSLEEAEIRALIANCDFGDAIVQALGDTRIGTPRDTARAKLELALIHHRANGGMVMN